MPSEFKVLKDSHSAPDEKVLLSRFWQSASGFWQGRSAWRAWFLVAALIATVLLQLLTQYRLNFWNRDFFNAIGAKDEAGLWTQAMLFVPLAAASLTLAIFSVWARMTLQRRWREWLSNHLYDYWLLDERYRRLRFVSGGDYQAPEYRIAEDARIATDLPVDLVLGLFSSLLTAATFIGVLWSVGDGVTFELGAFTVSIPGYLVLGVIAYSALLAASIFLIAGHLTRVMEENKRTEAELRLTGTQLRESGEGIADSDRSNARHTIGAALKAVIAIWRIYCWQLMRMTLVTHSSILITPIVGLLLCMPKYLAGSMSLGEVVQAAAAFVVVQTAFNWFTDNYGRLAEWTSSANRVASLLLALDRVDRPDGTSGSDRK